MRDVGASSGILAVVRHVGLTKPREAVAGAPREIRGVERDGQRIGDKQLGWLAGRDAVLIADDKLVGTGLRKLRIRDLERIVRGTHEGLTIVQPLIRGRLRGGRFAGEQCGGDCGGFLSQPRLAVGWDGGRLGPE